MVRPIVLGYFADFSTLPAERIDFRLYTHLCHAFLGVRGDGVLSIDDTGKRKELVHRARAAGVQTLISLGGADSNASLTRATGTAEQSRTLAARIAAFVRENGYDGVDVDWEGLENTAQQAQLTRLVADLRVALGKRALLTMAVPASDWGGKWFDAPALLPHVDFVNVMTYDYAGTWSAAAGHNAPLGFTQSGIAYWLEKKKWPASKLVVGIPLYGRGFKASKFGDPATGTYEHSYVAVHDLDKFTRDGWVQRQDTRNGVPYLVNAAGTEIISIEDADSVARKARAAKAARTAGIFFWEIALDFDGKTNPLVRAARAAL